MAGTKNLTTEGWGEDGKLYKEKQKKNSPKIDWFGDFKKCFINISPDMFQTFKAILIPIIIGVFIGADELIM